MSDQEFEVQPVNKRKRRRRRLNLPPYIVLIIVVMTTAFLFNSARFFIQMKKLEAQRDELKAQIEEQLELSEIYREELSRVGTDQYYEYLARKHLGYIYPDEKVMIVDYGDTQGD